MIDLGFNRIFAITGFPKAVDEVPLLVRTEVAMFAQHTSGRRQLLELLDCPPEISSAEIEAEVMRRLASGRLGYRRAEFPELVDGPASLDAAQPLVDAAEEVGVRYAVAIELLGEDDRGVAGVFYRLRGPDGLTRTGRLDAEGRAEITDLECSGECEVCFPELDESAWERLGSVAL